MEIINKDSMQPFINSGDMGIESSDNIEIGANSLPPFIDVCLIDVIPWPCLIDYGCIGIFVCGINR